MPCWNHFVFQKYSFLIAKQFKTTESKKHSILDTYTTTELFNVSLRMDRTDFSKDRSDFFHFGKRSKWKSVKKDGQNWLLLDRSDLFSLALDRTVFFVIFFGQKCLFPFEIDEISLAYIRVIYEF